MSTLYDIVDSSFLSKISDSFLLDIDSATLTEIIDGYRRSAIVKFKQCNKLSDRDDTLRQFNETLTDEEIEILANLMVIEWLKLQINSIELLKQTLSTKDYKMYSQSQHLQTLLNLKKEYQLEVNRLIVSYSYSINTLDNLRGVKS